MVPVAVGIVKTTHQLSRWLLLLPVFTAAHYRVSRLQIPLLKRYGARSQAPLRIGVDTYPIFRFTYEIYARDNRKTSRWGSCS